MGMLRFVAVLSDTATAFDPTRTSVTACAAASPYRNVTTKKDEICTSFQLASLQDRVLGGSDPAVQTNLAARRVHRYILRS